MGNVQYDNVKNMYIGYLKEMENSKSSNSLARYQVEHSLLSSMYKIANEENKEEEFEYIKERFVILQEKMKKFGIVLKELEK